MQLNELKEQYREELKDVDCHYELEDTNNLEEVTLDSDTYSQDDIDYLDEFDIKDLPTENEETMDYITEENTGDYTEDDAHDDVDAAEKFNKYETNNICDDGTCNEKVERPDERPGFFGFVSRFFQPLFAIAP